MHMVHDLVRSARLAEERHESQAPGIEAGEQRGDDQEREGEAGDRAMRGVGRFDDRILGEEAGKTDMRERDADSRSAPACR